MMNFIRDEKGQGLVEYALVLVLVAIVVIAVQLLLGPTIEICFTFCPVDNVTTPENTSIEIDYFDESNNLGVVPGSLSVIIPPNHGVAEAIGNGIILYTPDTGFMGDDFFDIELCILSECGTVTQQVSVGSNSGVANLSELDLINLLGKQQLITSNDLIHIRSTHENDGWNEIYAQLFLFLTRANQQIRGINEAGQLMHTAFERLTEILNDYALESGNDTLQDGIAALIQAVGNGDETAVYDTVTNMAADLAQVPSEVQIVLLAEGGPFIIDAHHALYATNIAEASFEATLQLWLDQEESEPDSTFGTIPRLQALWDSIEQRNQAIALIQPYLNEGVTLSINALIASGDEANSALAQQLNDDFHWGLLDEVIAKADIDNEGIRNSLMAKRNSARSAYDAGKLVKSGKKLCDLQHFVDVQENQHIDPHSAAIIRDSLVEIRNGLEIPMNCLAE